MDAQSMLDQLTDIPEHFLIATGTRIGHVHLSVKNALASSLLYQKVFDLGDKWPFPALAGLLQATTIITLPSINGLALISKTPRRHSRSRLPNHSHWDAPAFSATLKKARWYGLAILQEDSSSFTTEDEEGIRVNVILTRLVFLTESK